MTKIVGLTGGIGSGKTTVAKHFSEWGVPVYIADNAGKEVMEQPQILQQIRNTFGSGVFDAEILNRKELASIVFASPLKLEALNAIIHPAVYLHFNNWLKLHTNNPFVIKEAAILFESGSYKSCDSIITVTAPLEMRIQRIMERDHATYDDIMIRINNQWPDSEKIFKSDYIIHNTSPEDTLLQSRIIYEKLHNS